MAKSNVKALVLKQQTLFSFRNGEKSRRGLSTDPTSVSSTITILTSGMHLMPIENK